VNWNDEDFEAEEIVLDGIGGQNENFHEPLFEGNVFV
jgi:hypothetical protein